MKKDQFLLLIKRYEVLIASSLVIAATIFLVFLFLIPNFHKTGDIIAQQNKLQEKLERLKKKEEALLSLDEKYYKEAYLKASLVLPESKDYVSIFTTFDNLERQTGVVIQRTEFQLGVISTSSAKLVKAPNSTAYVVPISIEALGSSPSIENFIKSLADLSGRIMTIEKIRWMEKEKDFFQLSLEGYLYYYPLSVNLASLDTPLPKIDPKISPVLNKITQINHPPSYSLGEEEPILGKKNLFQ